MSTQHLRPFPSHFRLKDLTVITGTALEFKQNPHISEVATGAYDRQDVEEGAKKRHLAAKFELYAGMAFSDAEAVRLEICLAWILWVFCVTRRHDGTGEMQSDPDAILPVTERYKELLENPDGVAVKAEGDAPFAIIRHKIHTNILSTVLRFTRAMNDWLTSHVDHAPNRSTDEIPSVGRYIELRRRAYAWAAFSAMVEYSADAKLPEYVFDDPVLRKMTEALGDLVAWANDLCSFDKEQADGDYQNLVLSVMVERDCDLQTAIDVSTDMMRSRVEEYLGYKTQLPLFGDEVDAEVAKYVQGLEHYVQGCIVWNYHSPRYFPGLGVFGKEEVVLPVRKGKSVVATESHERTGDRQTSA
ncbi:isoprenoid synthase domain-containing protein [Fomes fomentarius]|nr:isoprenoid synthase domain-containing protein [Fomes fomentarius]